MRRREFLRIAATSSVAPKLLLAQQALGGAAPPPPAPVPWTLGLNPATPLPHTVVADNAGAVTTAGFFSSVQMSTLARLSHLLLPPLAGRPGAVAAGAPAFLDFLIGTSPLVRQQLYTDGLDWVETQAQQRHRRSFAALGDMEAGALIQPWMRTWMSDHPPTEAHAGFINIAHTDIRTATMNSKVWSEAARAQDGEGMQVALFWQPIEPDLFSERVACARLPAKVVAAPRSEHTTPSFPR